MSHQTTWKALARPITLVAVLLAVAGSALVPGCASSALRRFSFRPVMWEDPDQREFSPAPAGFYSSYMWDGADNAFFRPASEFFEFEPGSESQNVNALDEVADSSWYVNRLSRRLMTPEEVARGACPEPVDIPTPWTIVGGKPDGANPGFQIRDANGVRYLLKTEGRLQPWRPGAADTIGSAIYYAAGFHTPCNQVVEFELDDLIRDPEATIEHTSGHEEPLEDHHVRAVLEAALQLPNGSYRASVSRFIDGRPISPWRYEGLTEDDPNDVIPHEHRRELRGMHVLAAWTDHVDSRQENTMAAWMSAEDADDGYVRHYMIDFGDCFGVSHDWDGLVRRLGHSGYLDFEHIVTDFVTLDLQDRPWFNARQSAAGNTLAYYDVERFQPDAYRTGYPNPAFTRHSERDAAWMARIIARFRDAHIDALVANGRFQENPVVERELARILKGRRDRVLERYLTRLSPLTWPYLRPGDTEGSIEVCLQDLATWSGIRRADTRRYSAYAYVGETLAEAPQPSLQISRESYVCATLPEVTASRDEPAYVVLDVVAQTPGLETTGPARVHLYATGTGRYHLVGLERPASAERPQP